MICIYCANELGLNQQYYHKCEQMLKVGADSPLAIKEQMKTKPETKELKTETEIVSGIFVIHETDERYPELKDRLIGFGKKKAQAIVANIDEIKKFAES